MRNKIRIILLAVIIIALVVVLLLFLGANKNYNAPYLDITYSSRNDQLACLTFYKNGKYSMYDCDSEPTLYFFDSENNCTYKYSHLSNKIIFNCKYKVNYKHNNYIKVLEWDNKHIKFEYEGDIETFYSINNNY